MVLFGFMLERRGGVNDGSILFGQYQIPVIAVAVDGRGNHFHSDMNKRSPREISLSPACVCFGGRLALF